MDIRQYPDPGLTRISDPVTEFNDEFRQQVEDLYKTILEQPPGTVAGMAAPQIGINKRFFFAMGKLYVNPIIKLSKGMEMAKEGCFSNKHGAVQQFSVWRAQSVWIEYQDYNGQKHQDKYNGYLARIIQHEFQHLNGVLCFQQHDIQYK